MALETYKNKVYMTIEEIKIYMISSLGNTPERYIQQNIYEYELLVNFWKGFNSDRKVLYVATGQYIDDEIDLDGSWNGLTDCGNLSKMLFLYLFYNLNYSKGKFEQSICNSTRITDHILYIYNNDISAIRDHKIDKIIL